MYLTEDILEKLNAGKKQSLTATAATAPNITLPDIMFRSFAEVKTLTGDILSWGEKNFLYQQAQAALKENKMTESRILSRANPQLANAVRLGIRQSSMLTSYNDLFPQRASSFVKPGSVASMFSPAGYLTELYREARNLHPETSQYHLDTRRPDLASLTLSQSNMDDELSTLSLSNELLMSSVSAQTGKKNTDVLEMLADYRLTGDTPYNQPYEATRQAIILQDPEFSALRRNPAVAAKMDPASLLGIKADISPGLRDILTEEITENNTDELIAKNFGNVDPAAFQNATYLASYYGLTIDEVTSFLTIITGDTYTPGVQYYKNDELIALVSDDEGMQGTLIQRTQGDNYATQLGYAELLPLSDTRYQFVFTVKNAYWGNDNVVDIGTTGGESSDLLSNGQISGLNVPLSTTVTLDKAALSTGLTIGITRWNTDGDGYQYAAATFKLSAWPANIFLLKLNKLIRLYKATGISPSDIRTVIESNNSDLTITADVLSQLFHMQYYRQTYGLDISAALVLSGAAINQVTHTDQPSAFTRLFNSPPLNDQVFSADGTAVTLNPAEITDTFRVGAIKRALGVNDSTLYTLWSLAQGNGEPGDFACTIENLSALYRVKLLADTHALNVTELAMLLSVSPYTGTSIAGLSVADINGLVSFVTQYTQWLKEQNLTVGDLYLMLTDRYSTTLSPDIENLLNTLKNGLAGQDLSQATESAKINIVAPFIAAALQLDSAEMATAILQWINQLQPQDLAFSDFLSLALKASREESETTQLVSFCQVLAQLSLITRKLALNAAELSWVVAHPTMMVEKATVLPQDIAMLYDLSALHALLGRCGTCASEVLTSLTGDAKDQTNTLSIQTLATTLNVDPLPLTQALAQVSGYQFFYSWPHLRDALQWLDVATTLNITPADVARLVDINYSDPQKQPTYADWQTSSHALQGGLNSQQAKQLQGILDERLSAAVSSYAITNITPDGVTSRDDLYSWLLIDNQVSAQVKTTRLAEAIASIQLYVNRALSGQEEDVDFTTKTRQFFTTDWDVYNKRYSTWAGVSELVYYPENYVDPTIRIGQTSMMDTLLQELSQTQVNTDTVEDGFKNYLTSFEEVANLEVISGYHDNTDLTQGKTWFVGSSQTTPKKYYWRNVDHSKFIDGKFAANAWSEWKEITCALNPVQGFVTPVRFNSRLYLVWIEQTKRKNDEGTLNKIISTLNVSHIRYDGTWAPAFTFDISSSVGENAISAQSQAIYCAEYQDEGTLVFYFYDRQDNYNIDDMPTLKGFYIHADITLSSIDNDRVAGLARTSLSQLSTLSTNKTSMVISEVRDANEKVTTGVTNDNFSIECRVTDISYSTTSDGYLNLSLTPEITINNNSSAVGMQRQMASLALNDGCDHLYLYRSGLFTYQPPANDSVYSGMAFLCATKPVEGKDHTACIYVFCNLTGNKEEPQFKGVSTTATLSGMFSNVTKVYSAKTYSIYRAEYENYSVDLANIGITSMELIPTTSSGEQSENFTLVAVSDPVKPTVETTIPLDHIVFSITDPTDAVHSWALSDVIATKPTLDISKTKYTFPPLTLELQDSWINASESLDIHALYSVSNLEEIEATTESVLTVTKMNETSFIMLTSTADGAQYMQQDAHRTRLNTLFARQLIDKVDRGIDAVLSMKTQMMPEPKLGEGSYVDVTFSRYDKTLHGNASFNLLLVGARDKVDGSRSSDKVASGYISQETTTTVTVFVPWIADKAAEPDTVYIGVEYSDKSFKSSAADMQKFTFNSATKTFTAAEDNATRTRGLTSRVNYTQTEPMDFSGANALYFWELFYYTPMMVFKRLLLEQNFTEATRWMHYIWNPAGYLIDGEIQKYNWNVRPLEEETTWHANPLDSVDPDAVAQSDPLHYKVATFMSYLDLLIARGDKAYRLLERDTLNEAKMWYVQALDLLGDAPEQSYSAGWAAPVLSNAADQTTQTAVQQALLVLCQQTEPASVQTANSLTHLFLPQQNEKLVGYWQTLAQRLYNLRHNLSIDGQPLSLSIYAKPADPAALLSAAVIASQGGGDLPTTVMPMYRFPTMLENSRSLTSQLVQFGSSLLAITERQDAEALSELLQTQGTELILQNIALQNMDITALDADKAALDESRNAAKSRQDTYTKLYNENINAGEENAMKLFLSASITAIGGKAFHLAGGALDLAPNIFGTADGGSRWGAISIALGEGADLAAMSTQAAADRIAQSEAYRRRREEWAIQRDAAGSDVKQIDAQLAALAVRREAAVLQKTYLETQQAQTQAQMTFLQNKFTSKALYNWLRGKLAAIYYQYYDLTVSRCLMAQEAWKWALGDDSALFIRPGAWQGTYAGLMAGETLMLSLAQMEHAYLQKDQREKEVVRTVCLSEIYTALSAENFTLAEQITALVTAGQGTAGTDTNGLKIADKQLQATVNLADLKIADDYPASLGSLRRIKQISVTLPVLTGPYQDVRAMLNYGGSVVVPRGCEAVAVSHGMNDSGQFQLDFNDSRWLPFEGIPVDDAGGLTLSFPDVDGKQKDLLLSLTDIILHIRYTIVN